MLFFQVETTVAGLDSSDVVTCSRGVFVKPDTSLQEAKKVQYSKHIICSIFRWFVIPCRVCILFVAIFTFGMILFFHHFTQ